MTDYSTLSDAEINAKLAKAMGWTEYRRLFWKYPDKDNGIAKENWSPCTSRDDLAVVVGHIRSDINMAWEFQSRLQNMANSSDDYAVFYYLACPPRIIAEACLEVLEVE